MTPANMTTRFQEAPEAPATARACLNCGEVASLRARYCSGCGQRVGESILTVRVLLGEILEEILSLDGRLPRTVGTLLVRPGHLTREYAAGRIVRYVRPFRLYLATSIIFFLVLSLSIRFALPEDFKFGFQNDDTSTESPAETTSEGVAQGAAGEEVQEETAGGRAAQGATGEAVEEETGNKVTVAPIGAGDAAAAALARAGVDDSAVARLVGGNTRARSSGEAQRTVKRSAKPGFFSRYVLGPFTEHLSEDPELTARRFTERMLRDAPKAVIVLLPIFAFILKLLYIRRRRLYVEHLVFVLHVHAFGFLLAIPLLLVPDGWLKGLLWLLLPVYLYWAMRQVYGQSWPKTAFKFFIFGWAYLISVLATLVTVTIVAALAVGGTISL